MNQAVLVSAKPVSKAWLVDASSRLSVSVMSLILLVLASALTLVYFKDLNRRLFISYQHQTAGMQAAEVRWGKLLLEQSAWSTQERIQSVAQKKLHLMMPASYQIVMIVPQVRVDG